MDKEQRRLVRYVNIALLIALPILLGGGFLVRYHFGERAVQALFLLVFILILAIPLWLEERAGRRESRDQ